MEQTRENLGMIAEDKNGISVDEIAGKGLKKKQSKAVRKKKQSKAIRKKNCLM